MNFMENNFEPSIFRIIGNRVFGTSTINAETLDIFTSKETFKNIFNIIHAQNNTYFCHIAPIQNNQAVFIALKQANQKNLTINAILSYRVAHILLQRFEQINFNHTDNIDTSISCLNILNNLDKSLKSAYPNNEIELTGSEYTYIRPVAASCTSETIGHLLGKSPRTCEDRIKSLYKKLKCQTRRELTELCNYLILTSQELTLTLGPGQVN